MELPGKFKILIVTLSDRAFRGEYDDLSGPRIKEKISAFIESSGREASINLNLIPDEASILNKLMSEAGDEYDLIFTSGGTGIGPRDITIDVIRPLLDKEIPGVMELIRVKYGMDNPNAVLSRAVAGIMGKALVYTLPGSLKAVDEYLNEILKTLWHTIYMQHGIDTHGKH